MMNEWMMQEVYKICTYRRSSFTKFNKSSTNHITLCEKKEKKRKEKMIIVWEKKFTPYLYEGDRLAK